MTFDLKSVGMRGVFNFSRVRVLWYDGVLKVYTVDGLHLELITELPIRRPGYMRSWSVKTNKGDIILRAKCMACGGRQWWRIMYMPFDRLWRIPL